MSYIGTTKIGKMFLGNTEIAKAYLGTELVFQKGGGPTPPTPETPEFHTDLAFDGQSYVVTDFIPGANSSYAAFIGRENMRSAQIVFSNLAGTNARMGVNLGSGTNNTLRTLACYYGSSNVLSNNSISSQFSTNVVAMFLTPKRLGQGNFSVAITAGGSAPSGPLIFGQNPTGSGIGYTGKIRTFYVFGSEAQNATSYNELIAFTPIATFRPCIYNGEAGMWYVEGNKFFGNSGSGSLVVFDP